MKRTVAAAQLLLIFPAALFMCAVVMQNLRSLRYEPAHTAQRIVMWYAGKQWTLWLLLVTLPLTVFVVGCVTLLHGRSDAPELPQAPQQTLATIQAHRARLLVAATTLTAGVILAIVAIHMLAN